MTRFALAPRHRAVVRAVAEGLFAHDDGPTTVQLDALAARYEEHLAAVSRQLRPLLLLSLDFVRWLPLLLFASWLPFDALPVGRRTALLERMEKSRALPLVLAFVAQKTLLTLLFFESPEELRAMGYPGPERKRWLKLAA
jgi:hypothetical protein